MFLATGDADTTVRPRNSYRLAEALREKGAQAVVKTYPDVSHVGLVLALSRVLRGRAPVLRDMSDFFKDALAAP